MDITEVRIKLMEDSDDRLQAFCSITIDDCFVIRDLKIIEGSNGPFVAMPSRKLTSHCPQCGTKNHLRSQYCNQCGNRLKEDRTLRDQEGRAKLYADIAHPINSQCREMIQKHVIEEYRAELERRTQPYWDVNIGDPANEQLDYPAIEDYFFVARGKFVIFGLRAVDPLRAGETLGYADVFQITDRAAYQRK